MLEYNTKCDACENKATKILSSATSKECTWFFVGYYCDKCYNEAETAMREENLRSQRKPWWHL